MILLEGRKCYTIVEAAEILSIGEAAVRRSIARGRIQPVIVYGRQYITDTAIKEYDQQRRRGRKHDS